MGHFVVFLSNENLSKANGETYFFVHDDIYNRGFASYLENFQKARPGVYNYEKTPTYYNDFRVPARIKAMNSTIKVVNLGRHQQHLHISPMALESQSEFKGNVQFVIMFVEHFRDICIFNMGSLCCINSILENWKALDMILKTFKKTFDRHLIGLNPFQTMSKIMKEMALLKVPQTLE